MSDQHMQWSVHGLAASFSETIKDGFSKLSSERELYDLITAR